MSRPPLGAVLFDLDDTLHDDTAAYQRAAARVAHEVARERGVDAHALFRAYVAQAEHFWKNLTDRQLSTPLGGLRAKMWGEALNAVALADASLAQRCAVDYNRFRKDELRLWPGVLELLASLRGHGCKLALVTNGFAETHREKIALLRLESAFDDVFIADEVGMIKPDTRLFRHACERLGSEPAAAAMVGDRYERDVRGAAAAGLFTVWMNVRDETVPADSPPPDAIVRSVGEVEGALAPALKRG
ncbi:MAG TPA: HAD family hydrolase [Candidatus Baltobacteraceae bacterium]|nr:HAD family hydrolase [Candidatus Baltobacteraceae bacterium]